jgi:hypothetical protein
VFRCGLNNAHELFPQVSPTHGVRDVPEVKNELVAPLEFPLHQEGMVLCAAKHLIHTHTQNESQRLKKKKKRKRKKAKWYSQTKRKSETQKKKKKKKKKRKEKKAKWCCSYTL